MAYRKNLIIVDDTDFEQKLEVYINDQNRVYISVGDLEHPDLCMYKGFITLGKDDVQALIDELNELKDIL